MSIDDDSPEATGPSVQRFLDSLEWQEIELPPEIAKAIEDAPDGAVIELPDGMLLEKFRNQIRKVEEG